MFLLEIFKKRNQKAQQRENFKQVQKTISENQKTVYRAVQELNNKLLAPVNGRQVATHLGWDSASVTNRLSEDVKNGWLKVSYRKKGLDGHHRNFYRAAR